VYVGGAFQAIGRLLLMLCENGTSVSEFLGLGALSTSDAATRETTRTPCQAGAESSQRIALNKGGSIDGFAGLTSRSRPRGPIEDEVINCHEWSWQKGGFPCASVFLA